MEVFWLKTASKTLAVVYKHECDCHQSLLKPDWLIITSYCPPKKHNCSDWGGKQSINVKHNNFMDFPVRISPFPRLELMCTTLFLLCWFDYRAGRSTTCNRRNIIAWNTAVLLPVMGLVQASHFLAYRLPKHLRQYGLSSREVKCWPASCDLQLVHTKHSLCHGSSR